MQQECLQSYVPSAHKPHVRNDRVRPNYFEIYGYRPLDFPWKLLSPYEFLRYWRAEPLLVPSYYVNRGLPARTEWTEEGYELTRTQEYKVGEKMAKLGIHYLALDNNGVHYFLFPEHPSHIYNIFRHAWVLVRLSKPDVIVIEGLH